MTLLSAALGYIARGLHVIALKGKAPNGQVHPHGLHDAFNSETPEADVRAAFSHPDTTGVGIVITYPYFVVDIDGPEGAEAYRRLCGEDYLDDVRWVARTGRGLHLWYGDVTPQRSRTLATKLDLKGIGGYVAAPPSLHPDTGRRYEWLIEPNDVVPAEMPPALREYLDYTDREQALAAETRHRRFGERHKAMEGRVLYATQPVTGIIRRMAESSHGERNNILYWAACAMHESQATDDEMEELIDAASLSGLTRREVLQTLRSAARKVMA